MTKSRNSLKSSERLKSRTLIKSLFEEGRGKVIYPIKAVWRVTPLGHPGLPAQAGFAVSKKKLQRAVDRNLVKRRMREAYRQNKASFYKLLEEQELQVALMFLFLHKEPLPYKIISGKLVLSLMYIEQQMREDLGNA